MGVAARQPGPVPGAASCALLPQVPSVACTLSGHGGLLAVSCDTKLVVILRRDYRMLTAQLGVCHSMVAAGPSLLVTLGKDGILRNIRICIQQQHMLLHLVWVGDRYFDKPLFGCLQDSSAVPFATCIFLPDASVLRIAVCPKCDVVTSTSVVDPPKRGHVVIAAVHSAGESEQTLPRRTAVMFDDGHVSLWTEGGSDSMYSSQTHVGAFNAQLRLLGLFGQWLLFCDGSSLRLFDCGDYFVPPHTSDAVASLVRENPAVRLGPRPKAVGSLPQVKAVGYLPQVEAVGSLPQVQDLATHSSAVLSVKTSEVDRQVLHDAISQADGTQDIAVHSDADGESSASCSAAPPISILTPRTQSAAGSFPSPAAAVVLPLQPPDADDDVGPQQVPLVRRAGASLRC